MTWEEIAAKFRNIKADRLTAAYHHVFNRQAPSEWGKWHLCGGSDLERAEFETVATTASAALETLPGNALLEILRVSKPVDRWLCAVFKMTDGYQTYNRNFGFDENGNHFAMTYNGAVEHITDWSAILCLKLAAMVAESSKEVPARPAPKQRTQKLRLKRNVLFYGGKSDLLKPEAVRLWQWWIENDGAELQQMDCPGPEIRKVIGNMPPAVRKLITPGRPHHGPSVRILRRNQKQD